MNPSFMESAPGPEVVIDGRRYLYFAGTSYFGLHGHPDVIEAGCAGFRKFGMHTATTRAGFGNAPPVIEVERRAAAFFDHDAAFYFSSGYASNHILVQAVPGRIGAVFVDEAAHYCVVEAARLRGVAVHTFEARDAKSLSMKIRAHLPPGTSPLVMTDAITPATGVLAPLPDYVEILREYAGASMIADDAHGFGVLGENGRGTLEHFGLHHSANRMNGTILVGGTLAKALGGFGGIITGTAEFINRVRSSSHYYDGASAPPSPVAAASAKALEIITLDPSLRIRLRENSLRIRAGLRAFGLEVPEVPAAQAGVIIGDAANMRRIHAALREEGFIVPVSAAYPGVGPEGVMRFAVCAMHTPEMIDTLLDTLRRLL
jgi:7-keto-8-aminopelargonate synthetase-like enzyme